MSEEAINIRYEEIVRKAADEWRSVWLSLDNLAPGKEVEEKVAANVKKRMEAALMEGLEHYAVQRLTEMHHEDARKIADFMIDNWLKNGEIEVNEPSDSLRESISSALDRLAARPMVFQHAARQKKIRALGLFDAKVPMAQIARELGISRSTAKAWIEDEQEELAELSKTLSIYGYKAVKE